MCVLIPQEETRVVRKHNWKKRQEIMYNRLRADIFFPPGRDVMYCKQIVAELTLLSPWPRCAKFLTLGSVAHFAFYQPRKMEVWRENGKVSRIEVSFRLRAEK